MNEEIIENEKNPVKTKEKMSPKEKRNTIIIAIVGSLIAIGTIGIPLIGHFSDRFGTKRTTNPSFSWDNQTPGVYDEKGLFKTNTDVFTISKNSDSYAISSISLPSGSTYLVMPSAFKDNSGNTNSITKIEKANDKNNVVSSTEISIKGLYFPSLYQNIGASAFKDIFSLEEVKFGSGDGVQNIENNAFENNTNLKNITFSKNLNTIGKYAFKNDSSLVTLNLYETGVKSLGEGSFEGCSSLTNVYLPTSIASLPKDLFLNCTSLTKINYEGTEAGWRNLQKDSSWNEGSEIKKIVCKDKTINL